MNSRVGSFILLNLKWKCSAPRKGDRICALPEVSISVNKSEWTLNIMVIWVRFVQSFSWPGVSSFCHVSLVSSTHCQRPKLAWEDYIVFVKFFFLVSWPVQSQDRTVGSCRGGRPLYLLVYERIMWPVWKHNEDILLLTQRFGTKKLEVNLLSFYENCVRGLPPISSELWLLLFTYGTMRQVQKLYSKLNSKTKLIS